MLKTNILASQISNLTDARYFAAWYVDYLSFNCNEGEATFVNKSEVREMVEWIEGPKLLAEFSGLDSIDIIEKQVDALGLDGVVLGPFAKESVIKNIDTEVLMKQYVDSMSFDDEGLQGRIIKTTKSEWTKFKEIPYAFLDIENLDMETVQKVVEQSTCGLVVYGGKEEKVGYKSFDFLDELFEFLIDNV